jgi:dienelactone hydrolase
VAEPGPLEVEVHEEVRCEGYVRRLVSYDVPSGRASAFVCVPDGLDAPAPVVFCHHQHAGQFDLGKSEVCGLRGDPDQAYAAELAQRGFVTVAPDAIGFEERNWAGGANLGWFELSTRVLLGRTLLADCLQEISLALDYASSLAEVDPTRVGFIGHSYGAKAAMWAPAWDERIRVSVSNCGCIPYREAFAHDAGIQAEFVVPGFAAQHDVEDVLALAVQCDFLLIAAEDDVWSRGAREIQTRLQHRQADHVRVHVVSGGHTFRPPQRELAYEHLSALFDHQPER